jgi:CheY-like chemotaxis protein
VEAFRCRRPDVVFLDVNMPGGDGVEVLDTLRRLDPMVPIVMVTLVMEVAVAQRCLERGAFAYVPKPFELSYLDRMAALAAGIAGRHN